MEFACNKKNTGGEFTRRIPRAFLKWLVLLLKKGCSTPPSWCDMWNASVPDYMLIDFSRNSALHCCHALRWYSDHDCALTRDKCAGAQGEIRGVVRAGHCRSLLLFPAHSPIHPLRPPSFACLYSICIESSFFPFKVAVNRF
jgi:hypothetical protein